MAWFRILGGGFVSGVYVEGAYCCMCLLSVSTHKLMRELGCYIIVVEDRGGLYASRVTPRLIPTSYVDNFHIVCDGQVYSYT